MKEIGNEINRTERKKARKKEEQKKGKKVKGNETNNATKHYFLDT